MSHITFYMVGKGLGKIHGKQKASYSFIPLEMGRFVVSLTSLKGNWSGLLNPFAKQTLRPKRVAFSVHLFSILTAAVNLWLVCEEN